MGVYAWQALVYNLLSLQADWMGLSLAFLFSVFLSFPPTASPGGEGTGSGPLTFPVLPWLCVFELKSQPLAVSSRCFLQN